jgi:hypothetical protein
MNFGYIISNNLNYLSDEENNKLKDLQLNSEMSLISYINQQKNNTFINSIIKKVLNKSPKELLEIVISHSDQLSNCDIDLLGADNIKLLTFYINGNRINLDEFLYEYQDNKNCYKFYKKMHEIGFKLTEDMFYTFCEIGRDKKLLDFYLENIINYIDTSRLYIDNHFVMKHIIKLNKYDRNTIDKICFLDKEDPTSLVICYIELLNGNYTFNNNYILLIIMIEAIGEGYTHIFKHNEFKKHIINKEFTITVTKKDLLECTKFNEEFSNMIHNINDIYPEVLNDYIDECKKYFKKVNIIYLNSANNS